MIALSKVLRPLLKLSVDDFPKLAKRQFGAHPDMDRAWPHFEPAARAIVDNFWMTVDDPRFETLVPKLDASPEKVRGVAYEGAAMGLTLLDFLLPYKRRLTRFLETGAGQAYRPMVYIGAGLMLPRLPVDPLRVIARYDDAERWLILDGYGFYRGFFAASASLDRHSRPGRLIGEAARNFDSGLGRSLFFTSGANADRIAATINGFPRARRSDLWGGVGLACGYTGGVLDHDGIGRLLNASGSDAAEFAVGVALAAGFRQQTGHPADHCDVACAAVWGTDSREVARLAAAESSGARPDPAGPRYDEWRRRVRAVWTERRRVTNPAGRADR
jgi:enediyne biosynthesis protein E3